MGSIRLVLTERQSQTDIKGTQCDSSKVWLAQSMSFFNIC